MSLKPEDFRVLNPYERIDRTDFNKRVSSSKEENIAEKNSGQTFAGTLKSLKAQREVVFSKHAKQRLLQRGVDLNEGDLKQISQAVSEAEEKNVKTVAVVLPKGVLITDVKSRTVITAMGSGEDGQSQIFTNINAVAVRF